MIETIVQCGEERVERRKQCVVCERGNKKEVDETRQQECMGEIMRVQRKGEGSIRNRISRKR